MWLHFNVPLANDYKVNFIGYCYNSVNIIPLGVAKVIKLSGYYSITLLLSISNFPFKFLDGWLSCCRRNLSQSANRRILLVCLHSRYVKDDWKIFSHESQCHYKEQWFSTLEAWQPTKDIFWTFILQILGLKLS